jgi:hypothetical protein
MQGPEFKPQYFSKKTKQNKTKQKNPETLIFKESSFSNSLQSISEIGKINQSTTLVHYPSAVGKNRNIKIKAITRNSSCSMTTRLLNNKSFQNYNQDSPMSSNRVPNAH